MKCPCCGHAVDDIPMTSLLDGPFSGTEKAVLKSIVDRHPRPATLKHMVDCVYPYGAGPENENMVVRVMLSRIRAKLKPMGWAIPNAHTGPGVMGQYKLERL